MPSTTKVDRLHSAYDIPACCAGKRVSGPEHGHYSQQDCTACQPTVETETAAGMVQSCASQGTSLARLENPGGKKGMYKVASNL